MLKNNRKGNSAAGIIIALIIIVVAGIIIYTLIKEPVSDELNTKNWEEYQSQRFGFSIKLPESWNVITTEGDPITPKFTIYKPENLTQNQQPPFDHHAEATHVSIYPKGIPSEGEFSQSVSSTLSLSYPVDIAIDFVLEDNTPFATMINPGGHSSPWTEAGFLWGRVEIENGEATCVNTTTDEEILIDDCFELPRQANLELIRRGNVNETNRKIVEEILKSFRIQTVQSPISVTTPTANQTITSPLNITGQARGLWYFEASFPIELQDSNGNVIARSNGQAQGEWMTEDFVPFTATLTFTKPTSTTTGTLVLKKDNPSGLPENDAQVTIPIQF